MPNEGPSLRRVAVTGATGIVGQFVVRRLRAEGIRVRAATRQPPEQPLAAAGMEWCPFSLDRAESVAPLLNDCDALVHCAFAHAPGRYRGGEGTQPEAFWASNLGGTSRLLEGCVENSVSRVIVLSSRAVFGAPRIHGGTRVCADGDLPAPTTHYGALKRAEESLVRLAARNSPLLAACVRPTGVYGVLNPIEQSKWFSDCCAVYQQQPIVRVRSGTEVHGDDVADAIWRLLTGPADALAGQAYNCSDQLVSTRMLAVELNKISGQRLPLPGLAAAPAHPLRCDGLRQLGWTPGGTARLRATLRALVNQIN